MVGHGISPSVWPSIRASYFLFINEVLNLMPQPKVVVTIIGRNLVELVVNTRIKIGKYRIW